MKKIFLYNTLKRQKEEFKPLKEGEVKMYSCGPTTYDFLHVGNARAQVVADVMARTFKGLGYKVTFVRNFTDVDDKIIQRALEHKRDAIQYADGFVKECQQDMRSMGMIDPDYTPKVSETIPEIIEMVKTLVEKGAAYVTPQGEVLYEVPKFETYGKLSKIDLEGLQHGKRVEVDSHKRHPSDFVLWKPAKEGEPSWDSPWGKGRPGWHIECSAMAKKFLGESIDLHHGGVDLIFPHHENEIAQSEAANGKMFSRHWCHHEFINFGEEKMSKSLGNVVTMRDFITKYSGAILRQIFLSTHYRAKIDWSDGIIEQAMNDLERIHEFILEWKPYKEVFVKEENTSYSEEERKMLSLWMEETKEALAHDFNTPTAISVLFTLIRSIRRDYFLQKKPMSPDMARDIEAILDFDKETMGVIWSDEEKVLSQINETRKNLHASNSGNSSSGPDIEALIEERKNSKKQKNFKRADEIRDTLKAQGIVLLDHPDGTTTWKYQ